MSRFAVGLVALSDHTLVVVSPAAATRLGIDAHGGSLDLASLTTDPDSVHQAISLLAEGVFDACRIRTRLAVAGRDDDSMLLALRAVEADGENPCAFVVFGASDDPTDILSGLEEVEPSARAIAAVPDADGGRLAELEQRLRRIASEIEAAGVYGDDHRYRDTSSLPGLEDLTDRQREILARLLRGDRVPTISRGMHLATSTVRNHLTTVYRKVGVHSQAELIERFHSQTHS